MKQNKPILLIKDTKSSYHRLRELRMGELIKRRLVEALNFSKLDNNLLKNLSIIDVVVSPGYAIAKIFVSSLSLESAKEKVKILNSKKKQIRYTLTSFINLKYIPDLIFVVDDTFEKSRHIDELLLDKTVQEDLNR